MSHSSNTHNLEYTNNLNPSITHTRKIIHTNSDENTLQPQSHSRENSNKSRRTSTSFNLGLPFASSSSSSNNNNNNRPLSNPELNTPTDIGRNFTLVKNSIRMSTKRGNRYVLGAIITLGVFAFWHISGTGSGNGSGSDSTNSRSSFGLWPTSGNVVSSLSVNNGENSGNIDPNEFIRFDEAHIPETEFIKGVAGFSYFKNLYLCNGTFIALTSNPSSIPDVTHIMSAHPTDDNKYPPAGLDRWKVMTLGQDDLSGFGGVAIRKDGISMFFNDEKGLKSVSFLKHYFHFIGEVFLGAWRVLTTAGETDLPRRLMYRTTPDDWRDRAGLTSWFQQSVMPNTAIEDASLWEDRAKSGMTFLFDKITITDRWAAHAKGIDPWRFNKMTADLLYLESPIGWMEPLRRSMKQLVQTKGCSVYRKKKDVPVVLYINRQLTGRRLIAENAKDLENEMIALEKEGVIEWVDAQMETLSRVDQFCLALKADIIMGVHGNGLSHALWMKPGSAVLEFMYPNGFARDYATIAELMRHDYYAIHGDHVFTKDKWLKDDGWGVGAIQGFHSTNIPADGKFISGLIRKIAQEKKSKIEP
ncbi:uncharacterized protein I206_104037 [Kwoniella pini CBS 10737]|uniref:Glycosyltransferase 61 catalytic domain-containing protein n=1 Tax=Kwoniella pini CBS 10737 TaxID=1296096 RepID=A0A1B9I351_9TREE|nr:uncharacterized protein I206_04388 [Kwoniella pini CBS 10737]OCF49861.1 hypothetical protein I206_04388 [Kwoniella pini CBS 10737]